jgi:hypothetical protein
MSSFVKQYGKDFNCLNAEAICSWYEFPLSVLTPQGNSVFRSEKEFIDSLEKLLGMYRTFNFSHAEVLQDSIIEGRHGLSQTDVVWRLIDKNDEPIIDFEITYFFKEEEGETKICGVVSHNEFSEWMKKKKLNKG